MKGEPPTFPSLSATSDPEVCAPGSQSLKEGFSTELHTFPESLGQFLISGGVPIAQTLRQRRWGWRGGRTGNGEHTGVPSWLPHGGRRGVGHATSQPSRDS